MPYGIEFSPEAEDHLGRLAARRRALVLDSVDRHLMHQPEAETRNRKRLQPNPIAEWELRLSDLRVYRDVETDPEPVVLVRAVGVKQRNVVRIGGVVIPL